MISNLSEKKDTKLKKSHRNLTETLLKKIKEEIMITNLNDMREDLDQEIVIKTIGIIKRAIQDMNKKERG